MCNPFITFVVVRLQILCVKPELIESLLSITFKAPAGRKVQIRVKSMTGVNCLNGCWAQAIEPKILAKLPTNPRICCNEQLDELLTSAINPTPIVTYNRYLSSTFTFAYKFI
ncbi:unnamed protein product [Heligmosomoides polygyrus]|uniref:Uncharacterized protein n=1 Tax=Heligmosomoides polygyrus TaxID=6339 RepID=A0A183FIP2_HELPZ|nr:unnamed protein product [Heligmosomoides polygyrus]